MDFKKEMEARGLKIKWVAKQLDVNYNSFRVYLMKNSEMPIEVEEKLKTFLT